MLHKNSSGVLFQWRVMDEGAWHIGFITQFQNSTHTHTHKNTHITAGSWFRFALTCRPDTDDLQEHEIKIQNLSCSDSAECSSECKPQNKDTHS